MLLRVLQSQFPRLCSTSGASGDDYAFPWRQLETPFNLRGAAGLRGLLPTKNALTRKESFVWALKEEERTEEQEE